MLSRGRALRPGLDARAAFHHTTAALQLQKRLRFAAFRVTVFRSGAERRNGGLPQVRAAGSVAAWWVSKRRLARMLTDSLFAAA